MGRPRGQAPWAALKPRQHGVLPITHLQGWQFSCATHSGDRPLLLVQMLYIFQGELKLKKLFWFLVMVSPSREMHSKTGQRKQEL